MEKNQHEPPSHKLGITSWTPLAQQPSLLPKTSKSSEANDESDADPGEYRMLFAFEHTEDTKLWQVECSPHQAEHLGITAGEYVLVFPPEEEELADRTLQRMTHLQPPNQLAKLERATYRGGAPEYWYKTTGCCTLAGLLATRTRLEPGEVTTLAHDISTALTWAHRNNFAYAPLMPSNIIFTVDAHAQLLTPTVDFRGAPEATAIRHRVEDTRCFARLIWLALTGEEPSEGIVRKPLSLAVADAPVHLAHLLELALDAPVDALPEFSELTAALASFAKAKSIAVHRAAHPAISGRLPAQQPENSTPARRIKRQQVIESKVTTLGRAPRAKKKISRLTLLGIVATVLILTGIASVTLLNTSEEVAKAPEKPRSTASVEAVTDTPLYQPSTDGQSSHTPAASAESTDAEDAQAAVHSLIDMRNQVLAASNSSEISTYAVADSPVAIADTKLISSDTEGSLARQSLSVDSIKNLTIIDQQATAEVTLQASSQVAADPASGITVHEGKAQQIVLMTLVKSGEVWKLHSAEPHTP